jgi:DNA polymerase-3 subunit epsilon
MFGQGFFSRAAPKRFLVIDIESSGLDPYHDDLLAIAAIACEQDAIIPKDSFYHLLYQAAPCINQSLFIHGITPSAQRQGTAVLPVLQSLQTAAHGRGMVAFHADFDRVFLEKAMRKAGLGRWSVPWLDLAWLLPAVFPEYSEHCETLDFWLAQFHIPLYHRHHACFDAYATAQLFLSVGAKLKQQQQADWSKMFRLASRQRALARFISQR